MSKMFTQQLLCTTSSLFARALFMSDVNIILLKTPCATTATWWYFTLGNCPPGGATSFQVSSPRKGPALPQLRSLASGDGSKPNLDNPRNPRISTSTGFSPSTPGQARSTLPAPQAPLISAIDGLTSASVLPSSSPKFISQN